MSYNDFVIQYNQIAEYLIFMLLCHKVADLLLSINVKILINFNHQLKFNLVIELIYRSLTNRILVQSLGTSEYPF
jgi:hypothetical protein